MHVKLTRHRQHVDCQPLCLSGEVEGAMSWDPSPIPKFDNPKLEMAGSSLFGAGREQRHLCGAARIPSRQSGF